MAVTMNYGAAPTYVKIASQTLTSAATVTFSNIPQGYTDLRLIVVGGTTRATTSDTIRFQFNSDTTSTYSSNYVQGNGSAASAALYATQTLQFCDGIRLVGTDFGLRSMIAYDIMNYANTTTYKTTLARCVTPESTVIGSSVAVGLWRSTSAITSIYLQGDSVANFAIGSTFTLYGIKAALVPKATGGDIIVQDGSYWYHAYQNTGVFNPKQSLTADVLVVAGGGSGAISSSYGGGGGGAGGVIAFASQNVSTNQVVTIGAGGTAPTSTAQGNSGTNSTFGSLTAAVGGGGGGAYNVLSSAGKTGGSGGGAAYPNTSNAIGTSGQGNNGGANNGANGSCAGGGGAGGVGNANSGTIAGAGGVGTTSVTNWGALTAVLTATRLGVSNYLAGGGAGGAYNDVVASGGTGGGGAGGGGNVGGTGAGQTGAARTGSGGGGSGSQTPQVAGNGGSGIIIVRYPI